MDVQQRGDTLRVSGGTEESVGLAHRTLRSLGDLVMRGQALQPTDIHHAIRALQADNGVDIKQMFSEVIVTNLDGRPISPRTPNQRLYVDAIANHDITFGTGPAGTGKTFLGVAMAVAALKRGDVKRIILTRPAVEAGEKLGFLPGDLNEKVDPYLRPLLDALHDMYPVDRVQKMFEKRTLEVAPLAFMRGRTLGNAYILLDEAQNTTREQMKMFLTRLGHGSKMVITGDPSQIDLPRKDMSGLVHALNVLQGVNRVGLVAFQSTDVVRHPLVAEVVDAYVRFERRG